MAEPVLAASVFQTCIYHHLELISQLICHKIQMEGAKATVRKLHTLIVMINSSSGLSAEQEAWLESVSYGNISTDWPPLSVNQSGYLMINVQTFEQLTRTANYPYHQAGDVYLQFCTTLTHPGYNTTNPRLSFRDVLQPF